MTWPGLCCALGRFRPNRFGRSFGRKFGVLYDDYAKNRFVSGCAIYKKEQEVVLHTQEVTGSSPVAPTMKSRVCRRSAGGIRVSRVRKWVGCWVGLISCSPRRRSFIFCPLRPDTRKNGCPATFLGIIGSPPLSSSAALRQCPVSGRTVFRYFVSVRGNHLFG